MRREYHTVSVTVAAICSLFFLSSFSANDAHAGLNFFHGGSLNAWAGEWGCSFENESGGSPLTTISQLTIGKKGKVTAVSKTATLSADPFDIIDCTATGRVEKLGDHYIRYEVEGSCLGDLEVAFEQQAECTSVMNEGKGYTEIYCIDLTEEPDNRRQVALSTCKRVYPKRRH